VPVYPGAHKIEHRLFSQITRTWRGRPLTSHQVILSTIAATTASTGLKVTAVLDTGRYPTGTEVSDEQAKDLEDRFITRHGFHGTWNYTISPVPRAPAPQPAPAPPPGPDLHALADPAITGIPREDLAATAAALTIPWAAAREQRLHLARGGPRRQSCGPAGPVKLSLDAYLLAAVCRYRLGMTCRAIAALLTIDPSVISVTTREIAGLPARAGTPLAPGPHRLRTLSDLRRHAATAGITIPQADNPPADTLTTPETPETYLN
jgi:Rhodopirellula transposase DDE domain